MLEKPDTARPFRARFFLPTRAVLYCASLILFALPVSAQKQKPVTREKTVTVVFYNTENFYDTLDDPHKNDNEFLPLSDLHWNSQKYLKKVRDIARVLASVDSLSLPGVIGLAEVENLGVLKDLCKDPALKAGNYDIILREGHDPRGIDVALLYQPSLFRYLADKPFPSSAEDKSRFILYVKLLSPPGDTLHILVNHWKSRAGAGMDKTDEKRMENARVAKHISDSLLSRNPAAKVLLMGDFNDNPTDKSIQVGLHALSPKSPFIPTSLYDLLLPAYHEGEGTLYFKSWDLFDQVIVSGDLLIRPKKSGGLFINPAKGFILKKNWMLFENKEGVMVPNRMSTGKKYFGGYSDHLPVFVILRYFSFE